MTDRERLKELVGNYPCMSTAEDCFMESISSDLADYLLANGVIVPPCKVGDTVWCINNYTKPIEFQITILTLSENHYSFVIERMNGVYKHYCDKDSVGKWVFFTKEEAEQALKERE